MKFVLMLGLLLSTPLTGVFYPTTAEARLNDPQVVESVDLNLYSGMWYEIAHAPNDFQKDCIRSTAEYTVFLETSLSVHNVCHKADGTSTDIKGTAIIEDRATPAKLKVRFDSSETDADYWIVGLDVNYDWAVVSGPGMNSLYIISRVAPMDPTVLSMIIQNLKDKGFNTDDLIFDQYEE